MPVLIDDAAFFAQLGAFQGLGIGGLMMRHVIGRGGIRIVNAADVTPTAAGAVAAYVVLRGDHAALLLVDVKPDVAGFLGDAQAAAFRHQAILARLIRAALPDSKAAALEIVLLAGPV
jgi:hypothetical protein